MVCHKSIEAVLLIFIIPDDIFWKFISHIFSFLLQNQVVFIDSFELFINMLLLNVNNIIFDQGFNSQIDLPFL